MKKNQKGITLIALVVTIIVLLILAGVSIAMLTGQNGILNRATESSWKTKLGEARDMLGLTISTYLTDYNAVVYTGATSDIDEGNWAGKDTDDVIEEAIKATAEELSGDDDKYTIELGKTNGIGIGIELTDKAEKKYYICGTIGNVSVKWKTLVDESKSSVAFSTALEEADKKSSTTTTNTSGSVENTSTGTNEAV